MTNHIRQPRATYHKTRAALRRSIKHKSLRIEREAELSLKASLTSALDGGHGTTSRSSSIISGWKARLPHTQKDSLT